MTTAASDNGDAGAVFRPIRQATLVDEVQEQLRQIILDGALPSGSPIRESSVAEQMGVSRAPVREALRRLEQSGLVRKPPNRSYEVTSFSDRDFYELATLRSALETLAAREAMRDRPMLERRLHDHLRDIADAAAGDDEDAALVADRAFHECLVDCAANHRLAETYSTLRDQIGLCLRTRQRQHPTLEDFLPRHEALVERVRARDVDGLVRALDWHIRHGAGLLDEDVPSASRRGSA